MSLQGAAAALLLRRPAHGYELQATLDAELGPLWTTRASQLYVTLGRMQRDGLVTVTRVNQPNRPDRQLLSLTVRGRECADAWLMRGDRAEERVARLAVARVAAPDRFEAVAAAIVRDLNSRLRQLRAMRADAASGFQPEALESEIMEVQTSLRWTAAVRDRSGEILARPLAAPAPHASVDERSSA